MVNKKNRRIDQFRLWTFGVGKTIDPKKVPREAHNYHPMKSANWVLLRAAKLPLNSPVLA